MVNHVKSQAFFLIVCIEFLIVLLLFSIFASASHNSGKVVSSNFIKKSISNFKYYNGDGNSSKGMTTKLIPKLIQTNTLKQEEQVALHMCK